MGHDPCTTVVMTHVVQGSNTCTTCTCVGCTFRCSCPSYIDKTITPPPQNWLLSQLFLSTNPISLLASQHIHRCRFPASNNQKPCHPSLNTYHPLHLRITRATLNQRHEANFVVFTVCEKTTSPSKHSRESRRLRGRVRRRPFLTGWPTCEELSCGSNTLQASSSSSSPPLRREPAPSTAQAKAGTSCMNRYRPALQGRADITSEEPRYSETQILDLRHSTG